MRARDILRPHAANCPKYTGAEFLCLRKGRDISLCSCVLKPARAPADAVPAPPHPFTGSGIKNMFFSLNSDRMSGGRSPAAGPPQGSLSRTIQAPATTGVSEACTAVYEMSNATLSTFSPTQVSSLSAAAPSSSALFSSSDAQITSA